MPQHVDIAIIADVIIGSASIANLELLDYAALDDRGPSPNATMMPP